MAEADWQDAEEVTRRLFPGLSAELFSRPDPRIDELIRELPRLTEAELTTMSEIDSACPICFVPYRSFIAEEEMAMAMEQSAAFVPEELGVTKLTKSCGHIYCRKDIIKWMRTASKSCPTCRTPFLSAINDSLVTTSDPPPPSEVERFNVLANTTDMEHFIRGVMSGEEGADPTLLLRELERQLENVGHPQPPEQHEEDDGRQQYYGMYS